MNVLVVTAHHDDLELGCGATVAKLVEEGHRVVSLVMTHSGYNDPAGKVVRRPGIGKAEAAKASAVLGYELISHEDDTLDIQVNDANNCRIFDAVEAHKIDTVFTHWHGDTHAPHRRVNAMVLHVSRRIPRVFGFAVNWYIGAETFSPRMFVRVEKRHWAKKLKALRCYASEYRRAGKLWREYADRHSLNCATELAVPRAEGFMVYKHLWEF